MDSPISSPIRIEIVSDIICPWCPIGYLRLQKAIREFGGDLNFEIEWLPFELLRPGGHPGGTGANEGAAAKYGISVAQMQARHDAVSRVAQGLGFQMSYVDEMVFTSTNRAHQLVEWVGKEKTLEIQSELMMALFESFFVRHEDVGNDEVLLDAVERVGLPRTEARAVLENGTYAESVRSLVQKYKGTPWITGVPAYEVAGQYRISGAQEPERWRRVFQKLRDERS